MAPKWQRVVLIGENPSGEDSPVAPWQRVIPMGQDSSNEWHPFAVDEDGHLDIVPAGFGPQPAGSVLAGPTYGGDADPTFRDLVVDDIPSAARAQIGSIAFALTQPDPTYVVMDPTAPLLQADYPELFAQVGHQPIRVGTSKLLLPAGTTDIAYSPSLGRYVAISATNVWPIFWTSSDGLIWDSPSGGVQLANIPTAITWCSGIGLFVICDGQTSVFTSPDGYVWKQSVVGADAVVSFVAASASTILVAGAADTDNSIQYVFTTTDGISWTRRSIAVTGKTITALHWSAGLSLFVMGCSDGSIQTSPDGITWTSRTSNIASQINQIASSGALIVAVGNSGVISSSPDGATWTARTPSTVTGNLTGVAYSATTTIPWIAVGASCRLTSTDGTTWMAVATVMTSGKGQIFWSQTDSQYVRTGAAPQLASTSSDLSSWTARTNIVPFSQIGLAGAYGNGAYVIVFSGGQCFSSTNAITWTQRTANAGSVNLNHVIYAGGSAAVFVLVGASNVISTSPDGTTWTARTSNVVSTLAAIAYNQTGNIMVAVGSSGKIARSADGGVTWASQTSNTGQNLTGVAWNGSLFVAVGVAGVVITSADGSTWTKVTPTRYGSQTINWITSDGTSFYAITNGNACYISTDGVTWTAYATPMTLQSLNWMNNKLVGYGANGDIITSTDGKSWAGVGASNGVANYVKAYWFVDKFLVAGSGVSTSTDGIVWNTTYGTSATLMQWNGIAYGDVSETIVLVGALGQIAYSTDHGATWTMVHTFCGNAANNWLKVAYSHSLNLFAAVSSTGVIITSPDGINWTQRAATARLLGTSVVALEAGPLNFICWTGSLFVAVGAGGVILTSPIGVTWTERDSGCSSNLVHVVHNSTLGITVAVGINGSIVRSANGTTWTSVSVAVPGTTFTAVFDMGSLGFAATGPVSTIYSIDGTNWNAQPITLQGFTPSASLQGAAIHTPEDESIYWLSIGNSLSTKKILTPQGVMNNEGQGSAGTIQTPSSNMLAYDNTNDAIISAGVSGIFATWARVYDIDTEFVSPAPPFVLGATVPAWIKARN